MMARRGYDRRGFPAVQNGGGRTDAGLAVQESADYSDSKQDEGAESACSGRTTLTPLQNGSPSGGRNTTQPGRTNRPRRAAVAAVLSQRNLEEAARVAGIGVATHALAEAARVSEGPAQGAPRSPFEHAVCRSVSERRPEKLITHIYPNFLFHGRKGSPSFPPVIRRKTWRRHARRNRQPGTTSRSAVPERDVGQMCAKGGHCRARRRPSQTSRRFGSRRRTRRHPPVLPCRYG